MLDGRFFISTHMAGKNKAIILILAVLLVCGFCRGVHAEDDAGEKLAGEVLNLSGVSGNLELLRNHMMSEELGRYKRGGELKETMQEFLSKQLNFEEIKKSLIKDLREKFTDRELRDIAYFLRSDSGQRFLTQLPQLQEKTFEIGQQRLRDNAKDLDAMMADDLKKLPKIEDEKGIDGLQDPHRLGITDLSRRPNSRR